MKTKKEKQAQTSTERSRNLYSKIKLNLLLKLRFVIYEHLQNDLYRIAWLTCGCVDEGGSDADQVRLQGGLHDHLLGLGGLQHRLP